MIYEMDDGFLISSHGQWLPGLYATRGTAQFAFRFTDVELARLRDEINGVERRPITTKDLATVMKGRTEVTDRSHRIPRV